MRRFAKPPAVLPLQSSQQLTCGSKCSQVGWFSLIWVYLLPALLPNFGATGNVCLPLFLVRSGSQSLKMSCVLVEMMRYTSP